MIISDLSYIQTVSSEEVVSGGKAFVNVLGVVGQGNANYTTQVAGADAWWAAGAGNSNTSLQGNSIN
jgi:hypothetical protein